MDQAKLKYRIVGGIVLVSLLAILVPVLNDVRQPLPQGPQAIDIPAEPTDGVAAQLPADAPPLEGTLPLPADIPPPAPPPPLSEDGESMQPYDSVQALPPPVVTPAPRIDPEPKPEPVSKPAPAPVAKPAAAPPVKPVAKPMPMAKPAPLPAPKPPLLAQPAPTPVVKPVPANAAPRVVPVPASIPTPPAAGAPAPAAANQQAWVVQLGVFGNVKTAVALREQLRKAGHSAFTEEVTTPHGKALRVRVGPELDRATSQALRDRLARETGHDGIVVAYP